MSEHFDAIHTALRIFPYIAVAVLVPLMVLHYRRYGRVQPARAVVLYSFIFYSIAALFLVILPLPERTADFAARYAGTRTPQLVPFEFVRDLADEASILASSAFLQAFFNVLLLLPLGVYLRYYFGLELKRSAAALVATTLGFELLQYSGLLGLYPCPYRLFDVDDLMLNTAGGLAGFALAPYLRCVLPSTAPSYPAVPDRVTLPRRTIAFGIDVGLALFAALAAMLGPWASPPMPAILGGGTLFLTVTVIPIVAGGRTIGKAVLRFRIARTDGAPVEWYRLFARFAILFGMPYAFYRVVIVAGVLRNALGIAGGIVEALLLVALATGYLLPAAVRSDRRGLHELWSGTRNVALPVPTREKPLGRRSIRSPRRLTELLPRPRG
jgi:glycopeptide antibiotics resistance protein